MEIRDRVLQAALDCFTELGYDGTTIARIRERSGVSNGALFHHFPNKDAMASIQDGYRAVLDDRPGNLRAGVDGIIRQMLAWIDANQASARFLYSQGHLDWSTAAGSEMRTRNADLADAYAQWLESFSVELRDMPMVVVVAVVTGPAHAIAQRWLGGQLSGPLAGFADDLIDAAVAGLSAAPTRRRRKPAPSPALRSVIRVQMIGDDGTVLAEGEGVAELTAVDPIGL